MPTAQPNGHVGGGLGVEVFRAHPGEIGDRHAQLASTTLEHLLKRHVGRARSQAKLLTQVLEQAGPRIQPEHREHVVDARHPPEPCVLQHRPQVQVAGDLAELLGTAPHRDHRSQEAA